MRRSVFIASLSILAAIGPAGVLTEHKGFVASAQEKLRQPPK